MRWLFSPRNFPPSRSDFTPRVNVIDTPSPLGQKNFFSITRAINAKTQTIRNQTKTARKQCENAKRFSRSLRVRVFAITSDIRTVLPAGFPEALRQVLRSWTAVQLAVQHQFAGPRSSMIYTDLIEQLLHLFDTSSFFISFALRSALCACARCV